MALEVPKSLINQLQISFRKQAGIESYNPDDPSCITNLPSLQQTISELDPSPPYLRCHQCKGPLLRGLQSMVCVYCGAQQRRDIPPDPIHFRSTLAYHCLLQSLGLNGSEPVEESDSTKGKYASKDQLVLSDLFDYELKWPPESEKNESKTVDKAPQHSKPSLNLAGVDLDNFFSETNKEASESSSKEQELPRREMSSTESHAFSGQETLNLFENPQSDTSCRSTDGALPDPFSGWEPEFQSASSTALRVESKPNDLFPSSPSTDISVPGKVAFVNDPEDKFEFDRLNNDAKLKEHSVPHTMSDSWMQDDQWHSSNTELPTKTSQLEMSRNSSNNIEPIDNSNNNSATKNNWIHDDLWPIGSGKAPKNEETKDEDDGFDAWQDFTSSTNAPDPVASSLNHASTTSVPTKGQASQVNFDNNVEVMDFGNFMESDIFSGAPNLHKNSADENSMQESSTSDRMLDGKIGGDAKSNAATGSKSADNTVESLMSQMPDLSFMLESNLSIPKEDQFDSISWN